MSNGKGDAPRPLSVSREEYEINFDRVFGGKRRTYRARVTIDSDVPRVADGRPLNTLRLGER